MLAAAAAMRPVSSEMEVSSSLSCLGSGAVFRSHDHDFNFWIWPLAFRMAFFGLGAWLDEAPGCAAYEHCWDSLHDHSQGRDHGQDH